MRGRVHEPGAGFTERADFTRGSGGGTVGIAVEDQPRALAGPVSVAGTFDATTDWAAISLEIRPGGAPPESPSIAVTPASHDYGSLVAGADSAGQVFEIRNEGYQGLSVTSTNLTGASAAEFAIVSGGAPFTVAPGATHEVTVTFAPASVGTKAATLAIASNDAGRNQLNVALAGTGIAAPVPGGTVVLEDVATGGSVSSISVTTSGPVTAAANHLYLATVASKSYESVVRVQGLGLAWTRVRAQCAGRGQTGIEVWQALGTPSGNGAVTATLAAIPNSAVIMVARYSGVLTTDPLGAVVSGNTNGAGGTCSGGTDGSVYAFNLTTSVANAVVHSSCTMRSKVHTPGAGFTERAELHAGSSGSASSAAVMDETIATPAAVSVSGSFDGTVDWAMIGVEIKPGSPAAGAARLADSENAPDSRTVSGPEPRSGRLPDAFEVTRVYPNPFRSSVTIEYALPEQAHVSIAIYDVRGRVVRMLACEIQSAGRRDVVWSGGTHAGARAAPGVYFVRWEAGGRVATKKLLLQR
jgi:hypothetical protein